MKTIGIAGARVGFPRLLDRVVKGRRLDGLTVSAMVAEGRD